MITFFIIILAYWLVSVVATYIVRYYNSKKPSYGNLFAGKVSVGKKISTHLSIWLIVPIAMPFILIYLVCKFFDKLKYKNRPRPITGKLRGFYKKDFVFDENNKAVSLYEYNYTHGTKYTLDQVYGKGYEASLSEKEKKEFDTKSSKFGELKFDDNLLDTPHTVAAITLGKAILSGDFNFFSSMLDANVETILCGAKKCIIGKEQVVAYWKGWRERWTVTKEVTEYEVKHSNYYFNSCLRMGTMLVLFMMNGTKISRLVLVQRNISGGLYTHNDDLIKDYPFSLEYIKRHIEPLREPNEYNSPVVKENRLPCFSCGAKSETLDWFSTDIKIGLHGYRGVVSICPKCGKVVEYVTELRYRMEAPVFDEYDMLEEYARCWNKKDIGRLEEFLADDFHYSSMWVFEELDKSGYIEYFAAKLQQILETGSKVRADLKDNLLVVNQDGKNFVIDVKFDNGKIVRADMVAASLYGLPDNDVAVKFNLMGLRNFYNSTPLKGSKYLELVPEDIVVKMLDYSRLGDIDPYITKKLRDVVEECDWSFFRDMVSNDTNSFEILKSCYKKAVDDGIYEAANILGIIAFNYEDDVEEGNRWLDYAAFRGSQNAMINQFTIHWSSEEYLEASAMLSNMLNKPNPSLMCLWNLAYLYYMGDSQPGCFIEQDIHKTMQILSMIASYDKDKICEQETHLPEKAKNLLSFIGNSNIYAETGVEFHRLLLTSVLRTTELKDKGEVFGKLSSLGLVDGKKLGLRLAEDFDDESNFYIYDNGENVDKDVIKHLIAMPTAMSAWQVYLLMTSPTVMPALGHGCYIKRDYIFNENDIKYIGQLKDLDLSAIKELGLLLPKVVLEETDSEDKCIAHVYCSYWNDWKGLVQEHSKVIINSGKVELCEKLNEFVCYSYDCGVYL